jgi:hypothetical protein
LQAQMMPPLKSFFLLSNRNAKSENDTLLWDNHRELEGNNF